VSNIGMASTRIVEVGLSNRVTAEIKSGLEPGERVVVGLKPATAAQAQSSQRGNGAASAGARGAGGFGRARGFF
jgi:macrolide-specific efflux system membrane fusion protein